MSIFLQKKKTTTTVREIISATKKLSNDEKQVIRMSLFVEDAIDEMKNFETFLKKSKSKTKKTNKQIVDIVDDIRKRNTRV